MGSSRRTFMFWYVLPSLSSTLSKAFEEGPTEKESECGCILIR